MTRNTPLKVFGVRDYVGARAVRVIVAAHSQTEAARLINTSRTRFRLAGSETRNPEEVELALSAPGKLFWKSTDKPGARWEGPRS